MADTNVIPLGPATTGNARKAQMVEHFARKLDQALAHGAEDLSVAFVIYGHRPGSMITSVSYDTAEDGGIPVRMVLTDAAALLSTEAAKMRGDTLDFSQ
jgi:hypothetical protein